MKNWLSYKDAISIEEGEIYNQRRITANEKRLASVLGKYGYANSQIKAYPVYNEKDKTVSYELQLPTDELFKKVHGPIVLHYTVYTEKNIILLTNITPEGILDEGHRAELSTYKGVMISKTNPEKDLFKINLLNMLGK